MIKISTTYINSFALACTILVVTLPTAWAMKNPIVVDRKSETIISLPEGEEILSKSDIRTCIKALDDHVDFFSSFRKKNGPALFSVGVGYHNSLPNPPSWHFDIGFYRNVASWLPFGSYITMTGPDISSRVCDDSIHLSPDTRYLVTGHGSGEIKIHRLTYGWLKNVKSVKHIKTLKGHTNAVVSVHLTNDGKYIVSGSTDHTIKIWEVDTGFCKMTLSGYILLDGDIRAPLICMTDNKEYVVSGSINAAKIRIWKISSDLLNFKKIKNNPRKFYSDCTITCQSPQKE